VIQIREGYSRVDYDLKVVRGTEVITPEGGWELNASGQIEEMGADKLASGRRGLRESFGEFLLGEAEAAVDLLDPVEREGRTWSVVRFTYGNGDVLDLLLDPADGHQVFARRVDDGEESRIRFDDWRMVEGLRVPFVQQTTFEIPMKNMTMTWETVAINAAVDPAVFQKPGETRQVGVIRNDSGSTGWIPMELHLDSYIYIRGKINGQETDIVLDSGAGMTVLDQATADRVGLKGEGELPAIGTGGAASASVVNGVTLSLGDLELADLTAAVLDLGDINQRIGRPLAVILGKEVFNNLIVDIDYPNSRIAFHDPARYQYGGTGHRVALIPAEDGHKQVEMQINDLPPAIFTLDTGAGGALSIFEHYHREHGLLAAADQVSEATGGGVGGRTISKVASVDAVTLGGYTLHHVPTSFTVDAKGAFDTAREAGNLGAGILRRFRIVFDYPNSEMFLEPAGDWDTRPFFKNRAGLHYRRDGGVLEIEFVAPGSPAEKAQWKTGDRIVGIDGKPIADNYWDEQYRWINGKAGSEVVLKLESGKERRLTLADYY
jgi:predicted aspartyl protease